MTAFHPQSTDNAGDEQEAYFRISVEGRTEVEVVPALAGAFRAFGGVLLDNRHIVFASTERNGLDFDILHRRALLGRCAVFDLGWLRGLRVRAASRAMKSSGWKITCTVPSR
jgi:hypothetical protein